MNSFHFISQQMYCRDRKVELRFAVALHSAERHFLIEAAEQHAGFIFKRIEVK